MRIHRVFAGLFLAALAVVGPLSATEPIAASEVPLIEGTEEPALPAELEALLTPEPMKRYGQKAGPCTVSVPCPGGITISCSGQTVCYWRYHGPVLTGFVECDGRRTTCELN